VLAKPVIAIELARDFDHLVNGLQIADAHCAVGEEHRLVQAADLQLDKLMGRIDGAICGIALFRSRAHFADIPSLAAISSMVAPAASLSMNRRSRFASSRFVARRRLAAVRVGVLSSSAAIVFPSLIPDYRNINFDF
jgi:hypothetical protein